MLYSLLHLDKHFEPINVTTNLHFTWLTFLLQHKRKYNTLIGQFPVFANLLIKERFYKDKPGVISHMCLFNFLQICKKKIKHGLTSLCKKILFIRHLRLLVLTRNATFTVVKMCNRNREDNAETILLEKETLQMF